MEQRFEFGKNWARFLAHLNDARIAQAEQALTAVAGDLCDKTFLDIGSGSGLSSLAAYRLGATVHSFDYDPQSVACTQELRRRYGDTRWTVEQGSALDARYIAQLGLFDVVYSWGVLHHTGDMRAALDLAGRAVKPGGRLWVAIYNDEGRASRRWHAIKRTYNHLPNALRSPFALAVMGPREMAGIALDTLRGDPLRRFRRDRGMSWWTDVLDWVGGYPFEVASPEWMFDFYRARGFSLERLRTVNGYGCNEFVFHR